MHLFRVQIRFAFSISWGFGPRKCLSPYETLYKGWYQPPRTLRAQGQSRRSQSSRPACGSPKEVRRHCLKIKQNPKVINDLKQTAGNMLRLFYVPIVHAPTHAHTCAHTFFLLTLTLSSIFFFSYQQGLDELINTSPKAVKTTSG